MGRGQKLAIWLLGVFLLSFLTPAYGSTLQELQRQQRQIQQEMAEQQKIWSQKNNESQRIMEKLQALEQEIQAKEREISRLDGELAAAQARVQEVAEDLARAEAAQEARMGLFRKRLKEIYLVGRVNYLEVLLQATSLEDFLVRMELLSKIAQNDIKLIQEIKAERERIAAQKARLEAERDKVAQLRRQVDQERVMLASRREDHSRLLAQVEEEKKQVESVLAEMEALASQIAAKIRAEQAKSNRPLPSGSTKGMLWHVPGYYYVSSPFGWRIHPLFNIRSFHNGIDIPAPTGTEVVAPLDGRIISTGWLGGYGNHISIDHGGGLSTLYAHLSSILVREGQEVKKGQVIGRIGSTGWSTGPHLHFTVMINGEPVNPMNYY